MAISPSATTDAAPPAIAVAPGLTAGSLVAGRYRLERRLGAGGGGTVWRCADEKIGTTVAIKFVTPDGDLERWRREVAMARRISDGNVCRVHDLGDTAELRYVTMELIEGDSLRATITRGAPAEDARALFAQIVTGAAAIHRASVVHRDLKPENVVVDQQGRAVIVDFGLAREPRPVGVSDAAAERGTGGAGGEGGEGGAAVEDGASGASSGELQPTEEGHAAAIGTPVSAPERASVTGAGMILGTPRYMSPEQAAGLTVDARTDVWALGVLGHELLTGAVPAQAAAGREIDPEVDRRWPGMGAVLRRCLAPAPEARFADAQELLRGLPGTGRRAGARARAFWRRPAMLALAAAALAVVVVAGGLLAWRSGSGGSGDDAPRTTPPRLQRLTITEPRRWPADAPVSVALAPDASRFAYTTADARLLVRTFDGQPARRWAIPDLELPGADPAAEPRSTLVTMWAMGWFSDGSIALLGATRDSGYHLYRVQPDGRARLLYRYAQRFAVAVTVVGDRVAIGLNDYAIFVVSTEEGAEPQQLATVGRGEQVMALAWSPDGKRLASARLPPESNRDAAIVVTSITGEETRELWHGNLTNYADQVLAWLDEDRLAFTHNAPASGLTQLMVLSVARKQATMRDEWTNDYVGNGSAARGVLLLLRGSSTYSVQLGDRAGQQLALLHGAEVRARRIAGWTSDGRLVFVSGAPGHERIVRAAPGQALEPWPGTQEGVETPDTVVGESVLAHRLDAASKQLVIERISSTGEHTELTRISSLGAGPVVVRCAGDRGPPCVVEEGNGRTVEWTELDPVTGARGARVHQRPLRERYLRGAALSPDGRVLAVVDGGDTVTLIDRTTGLEELRSAGEGAALQSLSFFPDGALAATALGFQGRLFGWFTFSRLENGRLSSSPSPRGDARTDLLRWFWRPTTSPDGQRVAVGTLDIRLEVWRADGL